jgi:hypothetical protein
MEQKILIGIVIAVVLIVAFLRWRKNQDEQLFKPYDKASIAVGLLNDRDRAYMARNNIDANLVTVGKLKEIRQRADY